MVLSVAIGYLSPTERNSGGWVRSDRLRGHVVAWLRLGASEVRGEVNWRLANHWLQATRGLVLRYRPRLPEAER